MSTNGHIRLLIAESNATLRDALVIFFSAHDDIQVVGQAADHVQARTLCRQLKPDVLLIDPAMQPGNAISLLKTLCQESADTRIIVLSSPFNGVNAESVIKAGAVKYVEKGVFASDLVEDVRQVVHQH